MTSIPFLHFRRTAEWGARACSVWSACFPDGSNNRSCQGAPGVQLLIGLAAPGRADLLTLGPSARQPSVSRDPFSSRGRGPQDHLQLLKKGRYGSPFHNWLVGGGSTLTRRYSVPTPQARFQAFTRRSSGPPRSGRPAIT